MKVQRRLYNFVIALPISNYSDPEKVPQLKRKKKKLKFWKEISSIFFILTKKEITKEK